MPGVNPGLVAPGLESFIDALSLEPQPGVGIDPWIRNRVQQSSKTSYRCERHSSLGLVQQHARGFG
jgi:hypothetical protein